MDSKITIRHLDAYHFQRILFGTDRHFKGVRPSFGVDVAESAHETDGLFPIRERMEFWNVALGKGLVEIGKYRHGPLT